MWDVAGLGSSGIDPSRAVCSILLIKTGERVIRQTDLGRSFPPGATKVRALDNPERKHPKHVCVGGGGSMLPSSHTHNCMSPEPSETASFSHLS